MTSHRVYLSAQHRWLLALFALIIMLVTTACSSALATQAAAPAGRDGAPRGAAQQPLTATSDPGVAPPAAGSEHAYRC